MSEQQVVKISSFSPSFLASYITSYILYIMIS